MLHRKNFIIGSALALVTSATLSSTAQAQSVFSDVPDNHWAAAAVKRLAEAGIIEGRPVRVGRVRHKQASCRKFRQLQRQAQRSRKRSPALQTTRHQVSAL
jgi:hypothetical protein